MIILRSESFRRRPHFDLFRALLALALCLGFYGCAVQQPVRTLRTGETVLSASLGGPWVPNSSPTLFVPYLTVGAMHGLHEDLTIGGNIHGLMAAFGVLGLDAGVTYCLARQVDNRPEVSVSSRVLAFTDFTAQGSRIYPIFSAIGSHSIADSTLVYYGAEALIEPNPLRSLVSPFVGFQTQVGSAVRLQVESKWMAANVDTRAGVFDGQSNLWNRGGIGIFLGGAYAW